MCTSLYRPWGRNGEDIECYGIDLDALYVNTGFRVAVLDVLRGPERLHGRQLCRFAGPEEFVPKKKKRTLFGLFSRKKSTASSESDGSDLEMEHGGGADAEKLAEANPLGNWLWQLATEVVPMVNDDTDVLNDELPPAYNRVRNPECHPPTTRTKNDMLLQDAAPGSGVGASSVVAELLAAKSDTEMREELTELNAKRVKVGLPALPNPNSAEERNKRLKGRRGALHLNIQIQFSVPRDELEKILKEYEGPFGTVAAPNQEVRMAQCVWFACLPAG